jgi:hypothetical protein
VAEEEQVPTTPVVVEEPDNTMTLAQYKAKKTAAAETDSKMREVENEFAGKAAAISVEKDFFMTTGGKQKKAPKTTQAKGVKLTANFKVVRIRISNVSL